MAARFVCGINSCTRSFTSAQSLATHRRSGHSAAQLTCPKHDCGHTANDASNLRRHVRMMHPDIGPTKSRITHSCRHCARFFGARGDNCRRHEATCDAQHNPPASAPPAPPAALPMAQGPWAVAATTVPAMGNMVVATQPLPPPQQQLPTPPLDMMAFANDLVSGWDEVFDEELFASHFPLRAADAAATTAAVAAAAAAIPAWPELAPEQWSGLEEEYFTSYLPPLPAAGTELMPEYSAQMEVDVDQLIRVDELPQLDQSFDGFFDFGFDFSPSLGGPQ